MISGVVLSRYVFAFFPKHGGYEFAQQVHILCAYWGFVCMSLHLGFHWSMMLAMARKYLQPSPSDAEALVCICCSEATSYSTIIPSL